MPISHDPEANGLHPPDIINCSKQYQQHAGNGEDHKEPVVLFEEAGLFLVMVAVQEPEKAMHHVPVCEPGDAFHGEEGSQQNQ
jgi:hypothetical protein